MKTVILAGGRGSRMGTGWDRPKPLLEVGGRPILEHVMSIYLDAGVREFVVCAGYRFNDFVRWLSGSGVQSRGSGASELRYILKHEGHTFEVVLADTGEDTMTGGRLRRVRAHLDEPFFLTYADGLADVDLSNLWQTHRSSGATVTVTAIPFSTQYGIITLTPGCALASRFQEKPVFENLWCSGGFFAVEPTVISEYCIDDSVRWEADVLNALAPAGALAVYRHNGYWAGVDYANQLRAVQAAWHEDGALWRIQGVRTNAGQTY